MSTHNSAAAPAKKVKPVQDGAHTVMPHLVCEGVIKAIEFYKQAFGAVAAMPPLLTPEGKVMHASIRIGDSMVMLVDEFPEMGCLGPKKLKGTAVTLHLSVENADAVFAQATKAGAIVKMPLQDMFWGDRYGILEDPFGHAWSVATHIKDLTPDEIRAAAQAANCA